MSVLSQRDPRWANHKLGSCDTTIGREGCKIVCLAMLANVLPPDVNRRFLQAGKYRKGCLVYDNDVPSVITELEIANRWPKIAEVYVPIGQHFVVALDPKHIIDPWIGAGGENNNGYKILNYRNITPKKGDIMTEEDKKWVKQQDHIRAVNADKKIEALKNELIKTQKELSDKIEAINKGCSCDGTYELKKVN